MMRVVAFVMTLVVGVHVALACGGRIDADILAPLEPVQGLIAPLISDDELTGRAEVFRFLYAFKDAKRDWSEQMWTLADKAWSGATDGSKDDVKVQPTVDTTAFTTAIKVSDWKKAHNEANAIVTAIFQRLALRWPSRTSS